MTRVRKLNKFPLREYSNGVQNCNELYCLSKDIPEGLIRTRVCLFTTQSIFTVGTFTQNLHLYLILLYCSLFFSLLLFYYNYYYRFYFYIIFPFYLPLYITVKTRYVKGKMKHTHFFKKLTEEEKAMKIGKRRNVEQKKKT